MRKAAPYSQELTSIETENKRKPDNKKVKRDQLEATADYRGMPVATSTALNRNNQ